LPLTTYLSSKFAGGFIENGGALANLLFHLLKTPAAWMRRWGAAALGLLGVTVLSTTFVQKLVLSAYADSTMAVALVVMGVLAWKILETLAGGKADNKAKARSLAWQFAWIAVALLNLKQVNLALLGLVLAGMFLVAKADS
jgi:hypothetical protein